MPARPVAGLERAQDRWRCEYIDHAVARTGRADRVALRRPLQPHPAADRECALLWRDNRAVRQIVDRAAVPALAATIEALAMQHVIHIAGTRRCFELERPLPRLGECDGVVAAAFEARPVPGRERGHL